jgi:hypothetical protein
VPEKSQPFISEPPVWKQDVLTVSTLNAQFITVKRQNCVENVSNSVDGEVFHNKGRQTGTGKGKGGADSGKEANICLPPCGNGVNGGRLFARGAGREREQASFERVIGREKQEFAAQWRSF